MMAAMDRRSLLRLLVAAPAMSACRSDATPTGVQTPVLDVVRSVEPLGSPWQTLDPFLFCVHHHDEYPAGNAQLGPATSLEGRNLGSDFAAKDGWSMYHGELVPGFPRHPHRGFETVTVVRRGLVDHSDSLGAAARYGSGDVQWLTAGQGIVHAEMFPLLDGGGPNPLELFQIWLNLPSTDKLAAPHFSMFWKRIIPEVTLLDAAGKATVVTVIAGSLAGKTAPSPPPKSWASHAGNDVAIWTLDMAEGAVVTLPAAAAGTNRMAYFFRGKDLRVAGRAIAVQSAIELRADADAVIENGSDASQLLLLQGRPIGEPVARRGPFVMNTGAEIEKAFADYRRTQFGGWPWRSDAPAHELDARFARHADGRIEREG